MEYSLVLVSISKLLNRVSEFVTPYTDSCFMITDDMDFPATHFVCRTEMLDHSDALEYFGFQLGEKKN
jgi:hypothetical protein